MTRSGAKLLLIGLFAAATAIPGGLTAQVAPPGSDTVVQPPTTVLDSAPAADSVADAAAGPVADTLLPVPIVLGRDTLGYLHGPAGLRDAEVRAEDLTDRLNELRLRGVSPDSVTVGTNRLPPVVLVQGEPILAVTPADVAAQGVAADSAVALYARVVREALALPIFRDTPREVAYGIALMLLATMLVFWVWRWMAKAQPRAVTFITLRVRRHISAIRFQRFEIASGDDIGRWIRGLVWLLRIALSLALVAIYFPLVFSVFPSTRPIGARLFDLVLDPIQAAALSFLAYIPNLFYIGLIVVVTWRGLIVLKGFFHALERGRITLAGFYPDWARPTFQLVRVLIVAFAVVLVWGYLPASDSVAFQGVAAFLGLLLTFGSASAVSNAVGGVVMVYMRAFQPGDRVQIADTLGDIEERGILVTRIRTPKKVVVTIPNSQVLGSHIINYSRVARDHGIVLHTTVTIGYDVPWPQVHETLLAAARKVDGIMEEPGPFVLQTALGDFTVSYELNAHTTEPERMGMLYSELHREIQTEFAKAGIEITSPSFHSVRDGSGSTIPTMEGREEKADEEVLGEEPEAS